MTSVAPHPDIMNPNNSEDVTLPATAGTPDEEPEDEDERNSDVEAEPDTAPMSNLGLAKPRKAKAMGGMKPACHPFQGGLNLGLATRILNSNS